MGAVDGGSARYPPRVSTIHLVVQQDIPVLMEFSVPVLMPLWAYHHFEASPVFWF